MPKFVRSTLTLAGLTTALLSLAGPAQATVWGITDVLIGSSSFGASSFHSPNSSNVMTGSNLASILNSHGLFGSYNDATGAFHATLSTSTNPSMFTLSGNLNFNSSGLLASNSQLNINFNGSSGALTDTILGFQPGYVCCGSTDFDPNSFKTESATTKVMTLWGANGNWATVTNPEFTGDYTGATLGMDLRIRLDPTAVPEPAALGLMGIGLLGMGLARRLRPATT